MSEREQSFCDHCYAANVVYVVLLARLDPLERLLAKFEEPI